MAAQIAGLELVLADGSIVTCSADDPRAGLFDAARVGLGALGLRDRRDAPGRAALPADRPRGADALVRGDHQAARADHRERALRVLLVPAQRGLPDQAQQPVGRAGPAAQPVAALAGRRVPVQLAVRRDLPSRLPGSGRDPDGELGGEPGAQRAHLHRRRRTRCSPARAGSGSRSRSTPFPREHLADVLGRGARPVRAAGTGGSASRSRSASPRPTTCGCPPRAAGTAPTSPSTSTTPHRTRSTSATSRRS